MSRTAQAANDNELTALYRHWDADGNLLYVGVSLSAIGRLSQHRRSHWFNDIAKVTIERFNSRDEALGAERIAIQTELPKHNIAHRNSAFRHHRVNVNLPSHAVDGETWDDENFSVYIVRDAENKTFHGLFWAKSKADLWDTFDEFGDPYGYEFAKLETCGGLVHPDKGIAIKQFEEIGDSQDEILDLGADWGEFQESELFSNSLCDQNDLDWEPFCSATEKYGLIARIYRHVESEAA